MTEEIIFKDIEKCSNCGFCKINCPTFKLLMNEVIGPRGRINLAKKNITDEVFYKCNICRACNEKCPSGIDIDEIMIQVRHLLVKKKKETEGNKVMIKNVREFGNPFGKIKKGEKPAELYCC